MDLWRTDKNDFYHS